MSEEAENIETLETGVGWAKAQLRTERQGKGLCKIDNFPYQKGDRAKPEPPAVINTQHRRPPEPPRKKKDNEIIAAKRAELQRLELEVKTADRERELLESRLEAVQHQIAARTRQLTTIASEALRLEDKSLPEEFLLLFRRSLYGGLGPHDLDNFARVGLMLSNRKLLLSLLQSEEKPLADQLAFLQGEAAELRAKLGPET